MRRQAGVVTSLLVLVVCVVAAGLPVSAQLQKIEQGLSEAERAKSAADRGKQLIDQLPKKSAPSNPGAPATAPAATPPAAAPAQQAPGQAQPAEQPAAQAPPAGAAPATATPPPGPAPTPAKPADFYARIDQIVTVANEWPTVKLYVSVYDLQNRPVKGLQAANFVVDELGTARKDLAVKTFAESQEGMAVLLVLDASGSMRGRPFDDAKRGVTSFLSVLGPADQAALMVLHDQVQIPVSFTPKIEDVKAKVEEAQATAKVTLLYDGLATAVDETVARSTQLPARKVIVVMSDGRDEGSAKTLEDVRDRALAANVPVYSVGFTRVGPKYLPNLKRISELTGGLYLDARASGELSAVYARIFEHLKSLYVITLGAKTMAADGQRHPLGVKVVLDGAEADAAKRLVDAPLVKTGIARILPSAPVPKAPAPFYRRLWFGALVAAVVLLGVVGGIIALRRKPAPGPVIRTCIGCGQAVQPDWTQCLYCNTKVPPAATFGRLIVRNGANQGLEYPLAAVTNTLGLAQENHVVLTGIGISKLHAQISVNDKKYELTDSGSETGTYVNGVRITQRFLRNRDVVRIGDVELIFEMASR
jgi:VWFA-related protein